MKEGQSIDVDKLAKEILKAIRGKRSQMQVSRRLGYRFNQIYRWESGITAISWSDFLRLAASCQINPKERLQEALNFKGDVENLPVLLRFILGERPQSLIAKETGLSRFSIGRWLKGTTEPRLTDLLILIDKLTVYLPAFVVALAGDTNFESLSIVTERRNNLQKLLIEKPWVSALLNSLEISSYRKSKKQDLDVLAAILKIPEAEIETTLYELKELGLVEFNKNKWTSTAEKMILGLEAGVAVGSYWCSRLARQGYPAPKPEASLRAHLMFTCSVDTLNKIKQRYFQFMNETTALIEADKSEDNDLAYLQYDQLFVRDLEKA